MGEVIQWPKHVRLRDGGELLETLFACRICNGAEGTLPTDCPGRAMTEGEQDAVMAGSLDFKYPHGWKVRQSKQAT